MLSLLQLLNSLLHCHTFNQEGEINPVKIKCRERNNTDDACKDSHHRLYEMTFWWCLWELWPTENPLSVSSTTPMAAPCSCSPFPDLPPLSHGQGQPSNGHLGMIISQLYWSHGVSSPKTLPWELLSEEFMNDKEQEI